MLKRRNWSNSKKIEQIELYSFESVSNNLIVKLLEKISEKIVVSRLSYFEQISDLLDLNQMRERKDLSAIDAIMNLTHDIELSLKEKKNTTCVFLDIKDAYDYVSLKQLLNVMKKLHLSTQVIIWIEEFMSDRSIELAFD